MGIFSDIQNEISDRFYKFLSPSDFCIEFKREDLAAAGKFIGGLGKLCLSQPERTGDAQESIEEERESGEVSLPATTLDETDA